MPKFRILSFFLFLITLFSNASAQEIENLDREQAREVIGMVVNELQKPITDAIKKQTGSDMTIKLTIENNALYYNFNLPEFTPSSEDMALFMIAANRQPQTAGNIMSLAKLLSKAEYGLGCRFVGKGTLDISMTPDRFVELMTRPMDQLGFDKNRILNELLEILNKSLINDKQADSPFESLHASIEGSFLTITAKTGNTFPVLADSKIDPGIKRQVARRLMTGKNSYFFKCMAKGAAALNLTGLKYNISDPDGNQRIININWDELNSLAQEADAETTPQPTMRDYSKLTKEEAREGLGQIAAILTNNAAINRRVSEIMDGQVEMSAKYENDTLNITIFSRDILPSSVQLGRFFYATSREPNQIQSSQTLATLLKKAESSLNYRYMNNAGSTIDIPLSADELIELKTRPLDELGFDKQKLLTEIIALLDASIKQPEEGVLTAEAKIDGKYITLSITFSDIQDFLTDDIPDFDMKRMFLNAYIKETGPSLILLQNTINALRELKFNGLKMDYKDLSGRQKIYTYSWNDLIRAMEKGPEAAAEEIDEQVLDLIDNTMNTSFKEEGIKWDQRHHKDGSTLYVSVRFDIDDEYSELGDEMFARETLYGLYAPCYKEIIEHLSGIKQIDVSIFIGDERVNHESFTMEEIESHVEQNDDSVIESSYGVREI